ncbi:hypothetical protein [Chitinophaga sp. sic0106]|uniref:hypothetical protein n=1 Tax=Chitinophaga sp. sic0106 TaxID=2854785 RepID=UPI001C4888A9|nr:hypothetical protein [Chitinophaga sp. sic0106]MBV7529021.1 hypothetical protein [Chitinophaga sp. sic0106]
MKPNFHEFPESVQDLFAPVFFMIACKAPGEDRWQPQVWYPPFTDDKGMHIGGYLSDPDISCDPQAYDPYEIYDHSTAMQHIATDALSRGIENEREGATDTPCRLYRLIPVYTGFEKKKDQQVMIFMKWYPNIGDPIFSDHWEPRLCIEGWADDGAEDWIPLRLVDHTSMKIPLFSPERAVQLIELQKMREIACGLGAFEYYTAAIGE